MAVHTDLSAPLSVNGELNHGGFLSGTQTGGAAGVTWRRTAAFSSTLQLGQDHIALEQGTFSEALVGLKLAGYFTPRINLQALAQCNSQADLRSAYLRFAWLNTAGTGLFVVSSESYRAGVGAGPLGRSLTVKLTRRLGAGGG